MNKFFKVILIFAVSCQPFFSVEARKARSKSKDPQKMYDTIALDYKEILDAYHKVLNCTSEGENLFKYRLLTTAAELILNGKLPKYGSFLGGVREFCGSALRGHTINCFQTIYLPAAFSYVKGIQKETMDDKLSQDLEKLISDLKGIDALVMLSTPYLLYADLNLVTETRNWTPFITAAKKGDTALLKKLIDQQINVNTVGYCGCTALHKAAYNDRREVLKLLLKHPTINVNEPTIETMDVGFKCHSGQAATALHLSIGQDHQESVKMLLAHPQIDVNKVNKKGDTPLLIAMKMKANNNAIIKALLAHEKIDVNVKNDDGSSPLLIAAMHGYNDLLRLLLARKDINKSLKFNTNKNGDDIVCVAIYSANHETLKLILDTIVVDINAPLPREFTYLLLAVSGRKEEPELVKRIIEKGANVNQKGWYGCVPLHLAVLKGHKEVAEILLKNGTEVNALDQIGNTSLHLAAMHKEGTPLIKMLMQHGAQINQQNNNGETPLHSAAEQDNKDAIQILLESGADTSIKNKKGKIPSL